MERDMNLLNILVQTVHFISFVITNVLSYIYIHLYSYPCGAFAKEKNQTREKKSAELQEAGNCERVYTLTLMVSLENQLQTESP